ncbi:hypothetical protein JNK13_06140 [bacterium]|nr:hypothetical protein [bacterium]
MSQKFNTNDKVVRKGTVGPIGVVTQIRVETQRATLKESEEGPSVTVTVLWNNGTLSHFTPDGLERLS